MEREAEPNLGRYLAIGLGVYALAAAALLTDNGVDNTILETILDTSVLLTS